MESIFLFSGKILIFQAKLAEIGHFSGQVPDVFWLKIVEKETISQKFKLIQLMIQLMMSGRIVWYCKRICISRKYFFFSRKERKNEGFMFVEMMMSVAN